jgi:hypothetical protein
MSSLVLVIPVTPSASAEIKTRICPLVSFSPVNSVYVPILARAQECPRLLVQSDVLGLEACLVRQFPCGEFEDFTEAEQLMLARNF